MSYFVHPSSYIDDNVTIGEGTSIWFFCHIQSGAKIGQNCTMGQNVNVANDVTIGNGCKLQNNISVYEGVELEDDVFCGPSMVFTNDYTPRAFIRRPYLKTLLKKGCSIGANATIVCGNTIGRYAMVGSGSVIKDNVPDYALMVGVPARQIGWVCQCGAKLGKDLVCPDCGKKYAKSEEGLVEVTE